MTDEPLSPTEQENRAIKAIALTDEGLLLHRYLRRILETVFDFQDSGALYAQNGRRTLARDLMRLMAEGIDDRRAHHTDDAILTRPSGGQPVSTGGRGARRRITADTRTGYDGSNGPNDTGGSE